MTKKITLSKKQKEEYEKLSKKLDISESEYLDYYDKIRKANKKGQRLAKQPDALYIPKFSLKMDKISSKEDFMNRRKAVNKVLQGNYKQILHSEVRNNLYRNLRNVFGDRNAEPIIKKFKKMSDTDYVKFFKENDDIKSIGYDSDQSLFNFIEETVETFMNRLADV